MEMTGSVHDDHRPTHVETRPMETDLGEFDAFAERWTEFGENGPHRRQAVLLRHRRSGAKRRGDDLSSALGRPVAWREAMPFLRRALEPLAERHRTISRLEEACAVGEAALAPIVAEKHRAHLIWIGKRLGGPLGQFFVDAARKGYAPALEPDTFLLHPIDRPDHVVFRGWYDAADVSASLEMAAWLPEIHFATTAHETIAASSIRRRAGDDGLELDPVEDAPVLREVPTNTHPTLEQLLSLRLDGMAEAFLELQAQDATAELSHPEWLGLLVDREVASRNTRRFQTRMRAAILDRLVHNAYRLELEGQSMRRSSDPAKKVDEGHGT